MFFNPIEDRKQI